MKSHLVNVCRCPASAGTAAVARGIDPSGMAATICIARVSPAMRAQRAPPAVAPRRPQRRAIAEHLRRAYDLESEVGPIVWSRLCTSRHVPRPGKGLHQQVADINDPTSGTAGVHCDVWPPLCHLAAGRHACIRHVPIIGSSRVESSPPSPPQRRSTIRSSALAAPASRQHHSRDLLVGCASVLLGEGFVCVLGAD
jgi:hypothetical protein